MRLIKSVAEHNARISALCMARNSLMRDGTLCPADRETALRDIDNLASDEVVLKRFAENAERDEAEVCKDVQ